MIAPTRYSATIDIGRQQRLSATIARDREQISTQRRIAQKLLLIFRPQISPPEAPVACKNQGGAYLREKATQKQNAAPQGTALHIRQTGRLLVVGRAQA